MSGWPSIADVAAYLREHGKEAAAIVVERVAESEQRCRQAAHENLQAYYALKEKYEPRPKVDRSYRAPPESDG